MAYTYIESGDRYTLLSTGSAITNGDPVLVPVRGFGIAQDDIPAAGGSGTLKMSGVYEMPANNTEAFTQGAALYWDGSELTTTAGGNDFIGNAFAAKLAAGTTGQVELRPLPEAP